MAETIVKKRPIDAFIEYFNDVKPYHAKILEVVEKYNFYDDINISIDETISNSITIANKPLCKGVGFGLEWDDPECGYDAVECCTLGTCSIDSTTFDNLTEVVSTPIVSTSTTEGKITVQGNYSYDQTFQIKRILTKDSFTISGDVTGLLSKQPLFFLVNYDTLDYIYNSVNSIKLSGNYAQQFIDRRTFSIYGSNRNDGEYHVVSANYTPATNITTIIISEKIFINDFGKILLPAKTTNSGLYNVVSTNFNGADTTVFVDTSVRDLIIEDSPTSIILKTGFIQGRIIELQDNQNADSYVIVDSEYDYTNNTTNIYIINQLQIDDSTGTALLKVNVDANSYLSDTNCKPPKENNLSVNFSEKLLITVTSIASIITSNATLSSDGSGYWNGNINLFNTSLCSTPSASNKSVINVDANWYYYQNICNEPRSTLDSNCMATYPESDFNYACSAPSSLNNSGVVTSMSYSQNGNQLTCNLDYTLSQIINGMQSGASGELFLIEFIITTSDGVTRPQAYQWLSPGV